MASGHANRTKGRTHGCTDQPAGVKKVLANSEPSTHGTKRTYPDDLLLVRFRGEADMHRGSASTASVADDSSWKSTHTANGEQVVNRRQPHAVRRLDQIPKSSLSVLAVEAIDCALARSSAPFFGVEKP
jgi:hypothetical protein